MLCNLIAPPIYTVPVTVSTIGVENRHRGVLSERYGRLGDPVERFTWTTSAGRSHQLTSTTSTLRQIRPNANLPVKSHTVSALPHPLPSLPPYSAIAYLSMNRDRRTPAVSISV